HPAPQQAAHPMSSGTSSEARAAAPMTRTDQTMTLTTQWSSPIMYVVHTTSVVVEILGGTRDGPKFVTISSYAIWWRARSGRTGRDGRRYRGRRSEERRVGKECRSP